MFVRCNFEIPNPLPSEIEIKIPGQPLKSLTPDDLGSFDEVTNRVVLECAGNGRTLMEPVPDGTPWTLGGVSAVEMGGVRLCDILGDLPDDIVELVFTGADHGSVGTDGYIPYQFSIGKETALSPDPLLVTTISGAPLAPEHGAPVRLVVPGHYAMKSVKWLTSIEAVTEPFSGHFVTKYRFYGDESESDGAPVDRIEVRSVIASPFGKVTAGPIEIRGSAWSGRGDVTKVEVSIDLGQTWESASIERIITGASSFVAWSLPTRVDSGLLTIISKATDSSGADQPLEPRWNANGYANNVAHRVQVDVV